MDYSMVSQSGGEELVMGTIIDNLPQGLKEKAIYIVLIGLVRLDLACCVNLTSCSLFNKLWLSKLA